MKVYFFYLFLIFYGCHNSKYNNDLPIKYINESLISINDSYIHFDRNISGYACGLMEYNGVNPLYYLIGNQVLYENGILYIGAIDFQEQLRIYESLSNPSFSGAFVQKLSLLEKENNFYFNFVNYNINSSGKRNKNFINSNNVDIINKIILVIHVYENDIEHNSSRGEYFDKLRNTPSQRIEIMINNFNISIIEKINF